MTDPRIKRRSTGSAESERARERTDDFNARSGLPPTAERSRNTSYSLDPRLRNRHQTRQPASPTADDASEVSPESWWKFMRNIVRDEEDVEWITNLARFALTSREAEKQRLQMRRQIQGEVDEVDEALNRLKTAPNAVGDGAQSRSAASIPLGHGNERLRDFEMRPDSIEGQLKTCTEEVEGVKRTATACPSREIVFGSPGAQTLSPNNPQSSPEVSTGSTVYHPTADHRGRTIPSAHVSRAEQSRSGRPALPQQVKPEAEGSPAAVTPLAQQTTTLSFPTDHRLWSARALTYQRDRQCGRDAKRCRPLGCEDTDADGSSATKRPRHI